MQSRAIHPLAVLILGASLLSAGCSGSNKTSTAGSSSSSMAASAVTATTGAAGLYQSLGGSSGVTSLASQFGANLNANPMITQALSAADILTAKDGLYNSIAKLAGQATIGNGADLLAALSGKNLNTDTVAGVGKALTDAANTQGLNPDQLAALTSIWEPVGKSVMAGE
jgi:hypothetical protein